MIQHFLGNNEDLPKHQGSSTTPEPAMATNPNPIPGLFASSMSEANPTHCPLCNTPVAGSDGLQLHYLTSCESYDRLSNEQPRPKPTNVTPPSAQRNTFEDVQRHPKPNTTSHSSQRNTFEDEQPRSMPSATTPTNTFEDPSSTLENVGGTGGGVATPPSGTSTVQFMWQPLTDIVYPEIMLLASFEPGSVSLKLDSDGGHYASSTVAIPNGTYEGQLVIGDSFIHPVKKFTVNNSNDTIILQFDVEQGKESSADSDFGVPRYGTGNMQQNPSYSGVSSYSYSNPTYSGYSRLPQDLGHSGGDQGGSGGRHFTDISSGFGYYDGYRTAPNTPQSTVQARVVRHTTATTPSSFVPTTSHPRTTPHSTTTSVRAADPLSRTTAQMDPPRSTHITTSSEPPPPRTTHITASSEPPPPKTTPASGRLPTVDPPRRSTHIAVSSEPGRPPVVDPLPRGAPGVSPTPQTKPLSKASTSKTSSRRSGNHGNREPVRSVSEFNVGELRKGEEFPSDMNVYQQLLEGVTTERDELKQSLERVNARWDGKVKRLEAQLAHMSDNTAIGGDNTQALQEAQDRITILQREVDTLRTEKDTTSTGSADLEKELQELKDRNTALEHQLLEYAETINDQSKYMRSQGASRGSGGMMADQDLIHISAFAKKQQLEHAEALAELQTKISSTSDTISNVQYTSMGISAEIEEYRVQNERFVQELARKDEEIRVLRLGRGGSQNRLELELATLREKVSAYQEEFENVTLLKDEIEHLRERTAQQEEEIRRLTADNQDLTSQFQTLLDSSEKADPEIARKAIEYDTLLARYHDLQQTRIGLENEVQPLREERASMLRENALMREGSNPESYRKLRLEYDTLKARCEEVESVLAMNEDTNREMQTKLNDATNPDMLVSIQSRMNRYKLERDQARTQIEALEQQLAVSEVGKQEAIENLREATEQSERIINEFQQNVARLEEEQSRTDDKIYRYREERNQSKKRCKDIEKQLADWKGLILKSSHFPSSDHDDQSDTASYSSPYPPSDQTGSPTSDYHPQAYTDDHHFQPEDPQTSQLETDLASLNMEPSKAHRKRTTSGSRAKQYKESSSFEMVDVKTSEGAKVMSIGRPRGPLNAKNKPKVVIKRGEEFEQGTLMFVGEVNGKELAGIQMDCRVSKPSGSGAGDNDGTYRNGKRYFKSPMGYALYVPVSKVFVEMESAYV